MRIKYQISEEIDEEPIVPDDLRRELERRWTGCYSISVCRVTAEDNEPALNAISLKCAKENDDPSEDFDDVAVAVFRIMMQHAAEQQAETPGARLLFRVYCYKRTDTKATRKKSRFSYVIQLDQEGGFEDSAPYMSPAEMEHMRMQMQLETERERNNAMLSVITNDREWQDRLLARVLEMSQLNNQAIEPLQNLMAYMGSVALSGWQTSYANMQAMFDAKQIDAEMKFKTRRSDKMLAMFGKVLTKGKAQFEAHIAKQGANGSASSILDGLFGDDDDEVVEVQPKSGVTVQAGGVAEEEQGSADAEDDNEPLAKAARYIGTLILPEQWFEIMDALRKPELRLLKAVFSSQTDEDFFAAWDALNKRIEKIAPLWTILDDEQQETLEQLREAVDAVREGADA